MPLGGTPEAAGIASYEHFWAVAGVAGFCVTRTALVAAEIGVSVACETGVFYSSVAT